MPFFRLDRIIADSGRASRSEAVALIKRGCVTVDGETVRSNAQKYNPDESCVAINGEVIESRRFRYIMMNKPQGYVSATQDRHEKTVPELLDDKYARFKLFPAGRLDKDAEGFLLLTNDGEFAHKIMSQKTKKRYYVEIDGTVSEEDIEAFAQGLELRDGTKCLPAILEPAPGGAYVTLNEGKYHQVKRMMAARGKPVKYLKRVAIGELELDKNLKPGEYLELRDEIDALFWKK